MYFTNRPQNYNIFLDYARDKENFLHFFTFFCEFFRFLLRNSAENGLFLVQNSHKKYIYYVYI